MNLQSSKIRQWVEVGGIPRPEYETVLDSEDLLLWDTVEDTDLNRVNEIEMEDGEDEF